MENRKVERHANLGNSESKESVYFKSGLQLFSWKVLHTAIDSAKFGMQRFWFADNLPRILFRPSSLHYSTQPYCTFTSVNCGETQVKVNIIAFFEA